MGKKQWNCYLQTPIKILWNGYSSYSLLVLRLCAFKFYKSDFFFFFYKVQNSQKAGTISSIIDPRLGNSFTTEGVEEYIQLIVRCVEVSSERRPSMSDVGTELERILDKEMSSTTIMGEGTPVVTLGSQLFRAAK